MALRHTEHLACGLILVMLTCVAFVSSGSYDNYHLRHSQHNDPHFSSNKARKRADDPAAAGAAAGAPGFLPTDDDLTIQDGQHAFFNCKVQNLVNETVSWIRKSDSAVLYIGDLKVVRDHRFELLRGNEDQSEWTLRLTYAHDKDKGDYECQLSTNPKLSKIFRLHVVVPSVKIHGDSEVFVEAGSSVTLKCVISRWLLKPKIVFWYHNGERLIDSHGGVSIREDFRDTVNASPSIVSHVTLTQASAARHTGKYECGTDNIKPAKIKLHVIQDENAAAMQRDVNSAVRSQPFFLVFVSSLVLVAIMDRSCCCSSSRWPASSS